MKSSFCIDLQRFMLIPTKFPLIHFRFSLMVNVVRAPDFYSSSFLHPLFCRISSPILQKKEYFEVVKYKS